jgi:hypothetical protein
MGCYTATDRRVLTLSHESKTTANNPSESEVLPPHFFSVAREILGCRSDEELRVSSPGEESQNSNVETKEHFVGLLNLERLTLETQTQEIRN